MGIVLIGITEIFIKQPIRFFSSKDNIFYLFSTGAQTLAGLFGLIMAGYVFLVERLDKSVDEDDTLVDIVKQLKNNYFSMICRMSIILFIAVLVALINILYAHTIIDTFNNIIGLIGFLLLLLELVYIIIFIFNVADPEKNEKSINILFDEIKRNNNEEIGDIAEFLKLWNTLESLINMNSVYNNKKLNNVNNSIWNTLKILRYSKEVDSGLIDRIDEMRRIRNLIVHGKEPKVYQNSIIELQKLINDIENNPGFGNDNYRG